MRFNYPIASRSYAPARRPAWSVSQDRAGLDFESARWTSFKAANAAVAEWLEAKADSFDFAASLASAVMRFGDLTPGQKAAAMKCVARDAERTAALPVVTFPNLRAAFDRLIAAGAKRYTATIGEIALSLASAGGRNPGAIYVKRSGDYMGKIVGESFSGPHATPALLAELARIDADPQGAIRAEAERKAALIAANAERRAAQAAAGEEQEPELEVPCGCCGILLTDPVSRARGIGPICAGKWGF